MLVSGKPEKGRVIFAHGAGAPMDSGFMETISQLLTTQGLEVVRFEFPYMQKRREDGKKRPPHRVPVLLQYFSEIIQRYADDQVPLYLAGKSMGGRIATMLAEQAPVKAVFVFGYPFHPPRKPENLRIEHLACIDTPVVIFQGTRDALGKYDEVIDYPLSDNVTVNWLEDGNHDLQPRKVSGLTQQEHLQKAVERIGEWLNTE